MGYQQCLNSRRLAPSISTVPLGPAGGGLGVLLKSGLVPVNVATLRFGCWRDVAGALRARVFLGSTEPGLALQENLRKALGACALRFFERCRLADPTAAFDGAMWEWSARADALVRAGKFTREPARRAVGKERIREPR